MIAGKKLSALLGFGSAALLLTATAAVSPAPQPAAAQVTLLHIPEVSYTDQIQPIFDKSCVRCHGGEDEGERRLEASLNLMSYDGVLAGSEFGSVVEAGDVEGSILVEMVEVGDMPEEGDPLTPEEIELIRNWIAEGAENN